MSQATLELILGELRNFREEVGEEFQTVRKEIQDVKTELRAEFHSEIQSLKTELRAEFRSEIQSLRTEIQAVRTELLKEIDAVKKEQQAIHHRLNSMEELYAQLVGLIKSLREKVAEMAEQQTEQEQRFSFQLHTQAASIEILHREQLALKTEIEMLKSQRKSIS